MSVEALPFVNWILWGALAAGTLLVVGWTEWRGGTTRGYRLFMAWVVAACSAVWLLSEMALAPTPETAATAELRRGLVWAFGLGSVAYLVASLLRRPRSLVAVVGGVIGLAALATLAVAGGTQHAALFAAGLLSAAVALGAVDAAMLLGHWYLVTPQLSPIPLRRMMWLLIGALAAQGIVFLVSMTASEGRLLAGELGWLTWLWLTVGILLPIAVTLLALRATRAASLQATTGLLYIGLAMVMAGTIGGASLSYLSGVPL